MVVFKSIIVFDAETTSMPSIDHNTTKIIELSFIGCEIEHLKNPKELPRVMHKLVLLFNPYKTIHPGASKVSGLSNELLMNLKPFRGEDVEILRHFISRLPQPVCIIAHNGDNFDFPILRRALEKVNKEFQNNVYCADSVKAFRSLFSRNEGYASEVPTEVLSYRSSQKRMFNESTPPGQRTQPINKLQSKHVSRCLFPDDEIALSNVMSFVEKVESENAGGNIPSPKSFKLKDIYYFYFKQYFPNSHRAEEDSKALLGCIMQCEGFLNWLNENAVIFNSVQPLF